MDIEERIAAIEREVFGESGAPMTPEQEWADVGLEGWEHWSTDCTPTRYRRTCPDGSMIFILRARSVWRIVWYYGGGDRYHEAPTLRDALRAAREVAPAELRRHLYPRDEWRSFGECEPEEGQWIEVDGHWACEGPGVMRHGDSPCTPSADVRWRPFSPPEQEAGRDEVAELRARSVEEAITALCEAADALDKPAIRTLAFAAQKVLADDARHIEAVPILFRSESGHKRIAMTWASIETHSDGTEESTCGVVEIEDGEESTTIGGLTRESQIVASSAFAACRQLVRIACTIDYDRGDA